MLTDAGPEKYTFGGALAESRLRLSNSRPDGTWRPDSNQAPNTRSPGCGDLQRLHRPAAMVKPRTRRSVVPLVVGAMLLGLAGCGGPGATETPGATSKTADGAGTTITASSQEKTSAAAPPVTATVTVTATVSSVKPTQTRSPSVLYRADWSAGMDGWSGSADWTALRGELLSAGNGGLAVAPIEIESVGDFAVEAEIRLVRYTTLSTASFGVKVRIQDGGAGYAVGNDQSGGVIALRTDHGGGVPATLDSQPFTPDEGWHRYRIEARGNELRGFVDGAPVLNATDNTFLTGKRVGLWNNGAQLSVRGFEVSELPA